MYSSFNNTSDKDGSFRTDFIPPQHKYVEHEKYGSAFFMDHNQEEYLIQRAFKSNNFTNIRDLPNNLKHGQILNERIDKVLHASGLEATNR